jgi:5-methylcytosine-specific restriction endonuclease McrA
MTSNRRLSSVGSGVTSNAPTELPSWSTQRRRARRRDNDRCQLCGDRPGSLHCKLEVHHVIPRAEGGDDALENVITLCDLCHAICHRHMGLPRLVWPTKACTN